MMQPQPATQPISSNTTNDGGAKKSSKKLFAIITAAILSIAVIVGVFFLIPNKSTESANGSNNAVSGTRTVMIYLIGSSLESEYAAGSADINEILASNFNSDDVNVLIYTGGAKRWKNTKISASENAIFEVDGSNLNKVKTYPVSSMVDPSTLTTFIDYAYDNYKTDLYDLIFWDHGGGPIIGYGFDELADSEDTMLISDLADALKGSKLTKQNKFEIIGFDACLMGSIEVGTALSDYGRFFIGSEEIEPGEGWDYGFLGDITRSTDSITIGKNIIDLYYDYYVDYPYDVGYSLSMADLSVIGTLSDNVGKLFNEINNTIDRSSFSQYAKKLTRETVYGADSGRGSRYDLVDLLDLASGVKNDYLAQYSAVETAYNKTVVYSKSNIPNTSGLSVYFPTNNKAYAKAFINAYRSVSFSDNYYDFLNTYNKFISGDKLVSKLSFFDYDMRASVSEEGKVSIQVPEELIDNYQYGKYTIWRRLDDEYYMPVYQSSNVIQDGTQLKMGDPGYQIVLAENSTSDTAGWAIAFENSRVDGTVIYSTTAALTRIGEGLDFGSDSVKIYFKIEPGETVGKITDVRKITTNNEAAAKGGINLDDWSFIAIASSAYDLLDENGDWRDDWSSHSNGTMMGTEIKSSNNIELRLVGLDYDFSEFTGNDERFSSTEYYCQFTVYDTQGDAHVLGLVKIEQ